ncbi:hypothetical protein NA57DRAFT_79552 [Rhizodiscina lignyota]|uniref:Uncharacterized protein n=1 Tax=Rhizodiscina lignyota TaxID=1504668 RepID=A0A9P4I8X9_9PEZI|nr:hypothetical protein NA57DRAFT_79552 [Rhizodiscina lignyota]
MSEGSASDPSTDIDDSFMSNSAEALHRKAIGALNLDSTVVHSADLAATITEGSETTSSQQEDIEIEDWHIIEADKTSSQQQSKAQQFTDRSNSNVPDADASLVSPTVVDTVKKGLPTVPGDPDISNHKECERAKRVAEDVLTSEPKRACTEDSPQSELRPFRCIPIFPGARVGDVVVILSKEQLKLQYRVDRSRLEAMSVGFMNLLTDAGKQYPSSDKDVKFLLELSDPKSAEFPALVPKQVSEYEPPTRDEEAAEDGADSNPKAQKIKVESGVSNTATRQEQDRQDLRYVYAAYNVLFCTAHQQKPKFEKYAKPRDFLQPAEKIIAIAMIYDMENFVRPHVAAILHTFHQELYVAVKDNAPRWLNLAISLEDYSVFTEATVHLVGAYPRYAQSWERCALPVTIQETIAKKAKVLQYEIHMVNSDLFLNTLTTDSGSNAHFVTVGGDHEAWMAVAVWNDWFRATLRKILLPINNAGYNRDRAIRYDPLEVGRIYRTLRRGGDAYLPSNPTIQQLAFDRTWDEFDRDLKMLKGYARRVAADLAKNRLIIDPGNHDLGYLTCAEINLDDAPWE